MPLKTALAALAALALVLVPAIAGAGGCRDHSETSASSCIEGHVWDDVAGKCVAKPST